MSVVKILAIVVVTSVVTILCIRSGQAMAKASLPPPIGRPEAHDRGNTADPMTSDHATGSTVAPNATTSGQGTASVSFAAENRTDRLVPETGNRTGGDDAIVLTASRSLDAVGTVDDGHPSESRSRSLPIVVRGKLIRQTPYPADQQTIDDDDDDSNKRANIIVDTGVYHVDNGPYTKQIDYNQYSSTDTDTSVAQEDGSTSYHNSYDLTYTVGEHPNDGNGWSPGSQPIPIYGTGSPHPSGNPVVYPMGRPPYGSSVPYPYPVGHGAGAGYNKQPPMHVYYGPPPLVGHNGHYKHNGQVEQHNVHSPIQQIQMFTDKIDWHKVGILALFKIGLVKLKVFGFLKILFLLLFKLKMFLIVMFFKFLLIAKLTKLFKLIMIPLFILALLPVIAGFFSAPMLVGGLLSIPGRIIEYLTEPVFAPVAATAATAYSATGGSNVLPTITSAKTGGGGGSGSDLSKPSGSELNVLNKRRLESLRLFDPAKTVLRKLMDSEKCVERIACRMAVAEKTGILPIWINRVLHQVSKFVPSKKMVSYFKAFDDVNNEIYTQTETPDNWAKWCTERYNCSITHASSKAMNLTDIKQ